MNTFYLGMNQVLYSLREGSETMQGKGPWLKAKATDMPYLHGGEFQVTTCDHLVTDHRIIIEAATKQGGS